jgi:hypothetical protein
MSEYSQIDDELLSAYLDDELAPAERARVDERLAADPAARQLLDELRGVSRAMKELPGATLGTDLRESVLRRAERAMLVPGELASTSAREKFTPSFPIGRSKRAWFWAVSALAAGILLMVFQQAPERNNGLPGQVARNDRGELSRDRPLPPLSMKAIESKEESIASAPVAARAESSTVVGDRSSTATDDTNLETNARRSVVATEGAAEFRGGGGGMGGMGGAAPGGLAGSGVELGRTLVDASGEDLLVVHVSVNRKAFESNAFDQLLVQNNIEVETPPADKSKVADPLDVEMVVVEAAPAQVAACLDDLNKDATNFEAVAIDDSLATNRRAQAQSRPEANLQQYNRGNVANQQQPELAPDNSYYYSTNRGTVSIPGPASIERNLAKYSENTSQVDGQSRVGVELQARAKRVAPPAAAYEALDDLVAKSNTQSGSQSISRAADGSFSAANAPAPVDTRFSTQSQPAAPQQNVARRAYQNQKVALNDEMMQVLFVLSCSGEPAAAESTPATLPAAEPPTATGSIEEGLKSDER